MHHARISCIVKRLFFRFTAQISSGFLSTALVIDLSDFDLAIAGLNAAQRACLVCFRNLVCGGTLRNGDYFCARFQFNF